MNSLLSSTSLPLVYDGDSYFLDILAISPKTVKLVRVIRFPDNQNTQGTVEQFRDLTPECRAAVIKQVNRRCPGKTVLV